jgi:hypothetical protein
MSYAENYLAHCNEETHGYEYISISWAGSSPSGKTNKYSVTNNKSGDLLGVIRWHGPWRQYVFLAAPLTLYSAGCLADIQSFLNETNEAHKDARG